MVLLFMSPWVIGFLAFTLYPMVSSLYFSFTSYDLLSTPRWIGLENYRFMFTKDPLFWTDQEHGMDHRDRRAGAHHGRDRHSVAAGAPKRGVKAYRTFFFVPTLAPAAPQRSPSSTCSTRRPVP